MRNVVKLFLVLLGVMCLSVATASARQTRQPTPHHHRTAKHTRRHPRTKRHPTHDLRAHTTSANPVHHTTPGSPQTTLGSNIACRCIDHTTFPYASFVSNHVSVVSDPLGGAQNVLKFAVADSDRPYLGAADPRADVETTPSFKPGDDKYIAVSMLVPTTMPAVDTNNSWFELAEIYGKPYGGSPPISVNLSNWGQHGQNHFMMDQDATHGYKRAWTGPASNDGQWHTVIFHVNFATDNTGSVQIYFDGQLQTLANGTTTLHEATLDPGINWNGTDGNFVNIQSYRSAGSFPGTVTTYMRAPKIGSTLSSVS